jgi:hypothetical protein
MEPSVQGPLERVPLRLVRLEADLLEQPIGPGAGWSETCRIDLAAQTARAPWRSPAKR